MLNQILKKELDKYEVKDLTFCELNPNSETVKAIKEINEISDNAKSCDDVDEMFDDILK